MNFVLLQQDIQFFAKPDATANRLTLIIFGAVVLAAALAAFLNARRRSRGRTGGMGINRQAKRLGLTSDQRRVVKETARSLNLQNPERLLSNPAYLNTALRQRIEQIDGSDDPEPDREREKALLFSVRRAVANAAAKVRVLPSSRQIKIGQEVSIRTADGSVYESMISSNVHNGLGVEVPYQRTRTITWDKGTQLQISFVVDPDRLFAFRTKVIGYNNVRGASVMFLEHVTNIRQKQKRRSPRREYDRPCYFYPVTVITVGRGRKAKKQAFVNKNRRIFGRFEDLSGGGCAIRTQGPLTVGSILKVDFEAGEDTPIALFGRIRSVDRTRGRGGLMHIMFTRVSRKNLNEIQSYVYGLVDA